MVAFLTTVNVFLTFFHFSGYIVNISVYLPLIIKTFGVVFHVILSTVKGVLDE